MPATRGAALLIALALCGCGVSDTGQPLGQSTGQPADQIGLPFCAGSQSGRCCRIYAASF